MKRSTNDLTSTIKTLDIVKVDAWAKGHKLLALLVENLIESPTKAFKNDWYAVVIE